MPSKHFTDVWGNEHGHDGPAQDEPGSDLAAPFEADLSGGARPDAKASRRNPASYGGADEYSDLIRNS